MGEQSTQHTLKKQSQANPGGKRAGSGRKAAELGKARTFRLPKHIDDWLGKQKNMTAVIASALEPLMQEDNND